MAGRPSSYKSEFAPQAEKLCLLGATDIDIADFFEVATSTLYKWKHDHPEFAEALKAGKDIADERVERSLYQKAVGYELEVEELFCYQGAVTRATTKKYFPPDTVAGIFWLKNRRGDRWRDVHKVEHGKPGDFAAMSDDELNAFIAQGQGTAGAGHSGKEKAGHKTQASPSRRTH